jgi:hypothetical protein
VTDQPVDDAVMTIVQLVRGHDASGVRVPGLDAAQRAGETCVICARSGALVPVGWIAGQARAGVHSWCVEEGCW